MFHRRNNSQKPGNELIDRFQQSFPGVTTRDTDGPDPTQLLSRDDIQLPQRDSRFSPNLDLGGLPKVNFSSPSRDPGLMPLGMLASQHPGCYTPNSSGMGAILHNQAGDLHSPSLTWKMTPPSRPSAGLKTHSNLGQFDSQCIAPQHVQTIPDAQQPIYAPSDFTFQGWDHEKLDKFENDPIFDNFLFDPAPYSTVPPAAVANDWRPETIPREPGRSPGERLRYHVALRTQTAMVKSADEDPVSYLNKGQVYGLMVMDLNPPATTTGAFRYRTFVRISFNEEEQRSNAALNWQLWQDGRRANETQHVDRDCLAIEFAPEVKSQSDMKLEQVSIDGFCVTWTPERANSTKDCSIPLRFNFLSTDFSHSKGVKGIPLRLCAKTELLSSPESPRDQDASELCYCKIKLFRDHGAERKHNNDLRHVQKSIVRLEQQIQDVQLGGRYQKRRRANTTSTDMRDSRGLDNAGIESNFGNDMTEDNLQRRLATSQGMLTSTHTISVLNLRGGKEDDPDNYPLFIARNQQAEDSTKKENIEGGNIELSQLTAEPPSKPAVCFFVRPSSEPNGIFRAIYLGERTAEDLKQKICEKNHIDPSKIERILRIINDELKIIVDDDLVNELPGGQTMIVDICDTKTDVDGSCLKEIRLKYGDQHL